MNPNQDEVVGRVAMHLDRDGKFYYDPEVTFRNLDEHIQDRLRAAEAMAEAARNREDFCKCGPALESERIEELRAALAAYEATFKEASK